MPLLATLEKSISAIIQELQDAVHGIEAGLPADKQRTSHDNFRLKEASDSLVKAQEFGPILLAALKCSAGEASYAATRVALSNAVKVSRFLSSAISGPGVEERSAQAGDGESFRQMGNRPMCEACTTDFDYRDAYWRSYGRDACRCFEWVSWYGIEPEILQGPPEEQGNNGASLDPGSSL